MVSRETMTIRIPDDLARGLEGIAAARLPVRDEGAFDQRPPA
jgi:predicted transcriptional regulator